MMKVYHLTKKENLYGEDGIASQGLIPQCGIRSKSINDNRVGISFTNNYYTLKVWRLYLYPDVGLDDLCILTFDIDKKECIKTNNKTEFFSTRSIPPEKIGIAHFYNKKTNQEIPFHFLQEGQLNDHEWGETPTLVQIEVIEDPIVDFILQRKK